MLILPEFTNRIHSPSGRVRSAGRERAECATHSARVARSPKALPGRSASDPPAREGVGTASEPSTYQLLNCTTSAAGKRVGGISLAFSLVSPSVCCNTGMNPDASRLNTSEFVRIRCDTNGESHRRGPRILTTSAAFRSWRNPIRQTVPRAA